MLDFPAIFRILFSCLKIEAENKQITQGENTMKTTKKNADKPAGNYALRSISTKIAAEADIGEPLMIGGIVRKKDVVSTVYGTQTVFSGEFCAEFRGDVYSARKCYLPQAASEILESADLSEGQAKFAFIISKKASDRTKQGYVWDVQIPLAPKAVASPALELLEYCR
jgi:hypothetical protein